MIPEKPDPSFNFALNWLSKSSPVIRIYTPENIQKQLHHAAREYLEAKLIINVRSLQVLRRQETLIVGYLTEDDGLVR